MKVVKETVFTGKPVDVGFGNYSSKDVPDGGGDYKLDITSILVVFNSFDSQLRDKAKNSQEFIDGVAEEVSKSLTEGGLNCFCSTFEYSKDFDRMNLPDEFSTLDDDPVFNLEELEDIKKVFSRSIPKLKKIKIVGIVNKKDLEFILENVSKVEIDLDSKFLVIG